MSASERALEIIEMLQMRKKITINELSDIFHVSELTIKRDLDVLTRHYPIQIKRGRYGGVYLESNEPSRSKLTQEEIGALIRAGETLAGTEREYWASAMIKLRILVCDTRIRQ